LNDWLYKHAIYSHARILAEHRVGYGLLERVVTLMAGVPVAQLEKAGDCAAVNTAARRRRNKLEMNFIG